MITLGEGAAALAGGKGASGAAALAKGEAQGAKGGLSNGAKRGPKTDPNAAHNARVRFEATKLKTEGNRILGGGGEKPEIAISTAD